MDRNDVRVGRGFVVAGFVLLALGTVITMVRFIVDGYLFTAASLSVAAESILLPLSTVMAAWAWWWLTQVTAVGPSQVRAMRRGLYGLSLQYLLTFTLFVAVVLSMNSSVVTVNYLVQWWSQAIGALAIAVGFFTMSRSLRASAELEPGVVVAATDPGD